jgi:hypothetical protein
MDSFPALSPLIETEIIKYYEPQIVDLFCHLNRNNGDYVEQSFTTILVSAMSLQSTLIIRILYKMIGYVRDFRCGKGERDIAYRMIWVLYGYLPNLAVAMLHLCVRGIISKKEHLHTNTIIDPLVEDYSEYPFGCWKDVKYFCGLVYDKTDNEDHPLIVICMTMLNQELYNDYCKLSDAKISLACKWVPREGSRFSWIFEKMALQWVSKSHPRIARYGTSSKCFMMYRKVLSDLNRRLNVAQVNMCEGAWSSINPHLVSLESFISKKNAFLNMNHQLGDRYLERADRRNCSHLFREHFIEINHHVSTTTNKSMHTIVGNLVKWAKELIRHKHQKTDPAVLQNILYQITLLNHQWSKLVVNLPEISHVVPILNHALSDDLAMGYALLLATQSKCGKKLMVADGSPTWVNLELCNGFVDSVETIIYKTNKGTWCDLEAAIAMIQYAYDNTTMKEPTTLICFGMSTTVPNNTFTMLYWNCQHVEKNDGIPGTIESSIRYVSGNPFDIFKIIHADPGCDSFEIISQLLENVRYKIIDTAFDTFMLES